MHVVMGNKWYGLCDQRRKKNWSMGLHKEEGLVLGTQAEGLLCGVMGKMTI